MPTNVTCDISVVVVDNSHLHSDLNVESLLTILSKFLAQTQLLKYGFGRVILGEFLYLTL